MDNEDERLIAVARLLADVAEDLAIEILSEATEEDYEGLSDTVCRLIDVDRQLDALNIEAPLAVRAVVANYRRSRRSN